MWLTCKETRMSGSSGITEQTLEDFIKDAQLRKAVDDTIKKANNLPPYVYALSALLTFGVPFALGIGAGVLIERRKNRKPRCTARRSVQRATLRATLRD